jgi:redox-sensing transcriptional repressor
MEYTADKTVTSMAPKLSDKVVGRLSLYRRLLSNLSRSGTKYVFSHELAVVAGSTAAQVRRDVMVVGHNGSPTKGYDVHELARSIGELIDGDQSQSVALVGVGNLGRALLPFFAGQRPNLSVVAAFDSDLEKVNRVTYGCRCYPMEEAARVIEEKSIRTVILAVPAGAAQQVVDTVVGAGVRGILNFAPARLRVPACVYVEDIDMTTSLEKVAFFARRRSPAEKG